MTQKLELLSEKGKQVLELKNVLLQNSKNPLIFNGLLSSIKEDEYEKEVYQSLVDATTVEKFESILLTFNTYTNEKELRKTYEEYRKKLNAALEKKKLKYFSSEVSVKDGGINIIRKLGLDLEYFRREFHLTAREANKYVKDGFLEKYASLKTNAIAKILLETAQKDYRLNPEVSFSISKFYYDEDTKYYNVDFIITVPLNEKQLTTPFTQHNPLVRLLEVILNDTHKIYHKML